MFPKKIKCGVCGYGFFPKKDEIYTAKTPMAFLSTLTKDPEYFDAMDCPYCGCQVMLKIRAEKVEEDDEKEEKELECQKTEL